MLVLFLNVFVVIIFFVICLILENKVSLEISNNWLMLWFLKCFVLLSKLFGMFWKGKEKCYLGYDRFYWEIYKMVNIF